jgi:hypothetical protein
MIINEYVLLKTGAVIPMINNTVAVVLQIINKGLEFNELARGKKIVTKNDKKKKSPTNPNSENTLKISLCTVFPDLKTQ